MSDVILSEIAEAIEASAEEVIHGFVLNQASLGVYDATNTRRPKATVISFEIDLLEIDIPDLAIHSQPFDAVVHAAGSLRLDTPTGEVERYLRATLTVQSDGRSCRYVEGGNFRAVYIEDVGNPNGGCKETAALANA